jgi:hypothetical protein
MIIQPTVIAVVATDLLLMSSFLICPSAMWPQIAPMSAHGISRTPRNEKVLAVLARPLTLGISGGRGMDTMSVIQVCHERRGGSM